MTCEPEMYFWEKQRLPGNGVANNFINSFRSVHYFSAGKATFYKDFRTLKTIPDAKICILPFVAVLIGEEI